MAVVIGYGLPRPNQPRPVSRIVAVVLRFEGGAEVVYPVAKPTALSRPPARIDLHDGKAWIGRE